MSEKKSEYRIRKNYLKRRKQLRNRIILLLLTTVLVLGSSIVLFASKAKAQSSDEEVFYKYYKSVTVAHGDTLWDYAYEYCDSHYDSYQDYVDEIINMNTLSANEITAGQSIIIPYYSSEFVG